MEITKKHLVMIPALATDSSYFEYQKENLKDIAEVTIPVFKDIDNISDMATSILENAPEQFSLCGSSMGGYIALEVLRQAPHRVTRLALIGTKASHDTEEALAKRQETVDSMTEDNFLDNVEKLMTGFINPKNNPEGALSKKLREMAKNIGLEGFKNQQKAIINRIDSTPFLADIKCKTAIICGRNDPLLPVMEGMLDGFTRAKFTVIEECGHLSPIEQPVALTALLRYWLF